jgi:hypothetical protein
MAHNITHPVETFKEMVAWDDWANGHGEHVGGDHVPDEAHPKATVDRAKAVQDAISDKDGNIPGIEDSKGVVNRTRPSIPPRVKSRPGRSAVIRRPR